LAEVSKTRFRKVAIFHRSYVDSFREICLYRLVGQSPENWVSCTKKITKMLPTVILFNPRRIAFAYT